MHPIIDVRGLTKSYQGNAVLRGIDLHAERGEVLALLGPNGAGKTTTVRILATLADADSGTVRVAGADVRTERRLVRRRIAVTGQYAALDDQQTGRENLRMLARLAGLRGAAADARTTELLERFALGHAADRRAGTYSGGMKRRLDLAVSLVAEPAVLFLDEPTTGLDPRSRQDVWNAVTELARGGTTVLLTTQYLEEADRLADRIAVLDGGYIAAVGTAAELKSQVAGHRLELTAADGPAFAALRTRTAGRALAVDEAARTVDLPVDGDARGIRTELDDLDPTGDLVLRFAVRTASLDDVFLSLTSHPTAKVPARV